MGAVHLLVNREPLAWVAGPRSSAEERTGWVGHIAVGRRKAVAPGKAQVRAREHRRVARCRAGSHHRLAGAARAVHRVGHSMLAVGLQHESPK